MYPTIHSLAVPGARLRVSEDSLLISFDKEHLSLSTAIYGGGLRRVRAVMNQRLRTFYGEESAASCIGEAFSTRAMLTRG